jgi:hypothetical protein
MVQRGLHHAHGFSWQQAAIETHAVYARVGTGAIDRTACESVANVNITMMTAEPMITRGVHYTALVDTIDHRGATKLPAKEREQLLEAADVLLFGEPDSEWTVRSAEVLIDALETSERWPVESCDQLREHLSGCAAPSGAS